MNIRTAIMKAADSIEQNPCSYEYAQGQAPIGPASTGCMLIWIGHFADIRFTGRIYSNDVARALGLTHWHDFTIRIQALKGMGYTTAEAAPKALRLYADKYHSAIPDNVIQLFNVEAPSPSMEGLSLPCALQTKNPK